MKSLTFTDKNGVALIVKSRKHAVFFEIEGQEKHACKLDFPPEEFGELVKYLEEVSHEAWKNIVPKEANSYGSDYYEYYDRELDNNGYLTVRDNWIHLERPSLESTRFYKFDKRKMQSFLYDLKG